ncbi:hypothetical protein PybrP1_003767 [[Pythium] brassicae (nom. inval.)]|nr:hypothetical protein PybrP1_003767 [[Pythium] brassicae (nom. inval.)]
MLHEPCLREVHSYQHSSRENRRRVAHAEVGQRVGRPSVSKITTSGLRVAEVARRVHGDGKEQRSYRLRERTQKREDVRVYRVQLITIRSTESPRSWNVAKKAKKGSMKDFAGESGTIAGDATNGTIGTTGVLLGVWESTEAFGTTTLDWTQALKDREVQLVLSFFADATYSFALFTQDATAGTRSDVTARFRHVVAPRGRFSLSGANGLQIEGGVAVAVACCRGSCCSRQVAC